MKAFCIFIVTFLIVPAVATPHAVAQTSVNDIFLGIAKSIVTESVRPGQTGTVAPAPSPQTHSATSQSRSTDISVVQARLTQLGYDPGPIDGAMGGKTAAAIRRFQSDQGMAPTGHLTSQLLAQLNAVAGDRVAAPVAFGNMPGPSFDCARAGTPAEHAICNSPTLAERDRRLADSYSRALAQSPNPDQLKQQQRAWIQSRSACGGKPSCLAVVMDQRIAQLGGPAGNAVPLVVEPGGNLGGNGVAVFANVNALSGDAAYDYLLARFVKGNPETAAKEGFLAYFAGWGCRANGLWGKSNLNPFELHDVLSGAKERLDAVARGPLPANAPLVQFEMTVPVSDYDFDSGAFPFIRGATHAAIGSSDYCNVARDAEAMDFSDFPLRFTPVDPEGAEFSEVTLAKMIGGLEMNEQDARAFYGAGYPSVVIRIQGQVENVMSAGNVTAQVRILPRRIELRTQGNEKNARVLAVLGPNDIQLPGSGAGESGMSSLTTAAKDVYLIPTPVFKSHPKGGNFVVLAGCLEPDEVEALRPAVEQAISGTASVVVQNFHPENIYAFLQNYSESYVLLGGDCLERVMYSVETAGGSRDDFKVIQIAKGAGISTATPPSSVASPQAVLAGSPNPPAGGQLSGNQPQSQLAPVAIGAGAQNVYLLGNAATKLARSSYAVAFSCLSASEAKAFEPVVEQAISAKATVMDSSMGTAMISAMIRKGTYALVAGDTCLEEVVSAAEGKGRSRNELNITQIVRSTAVAPEASSQTSIDLAAIDGVASLLRLYLPTYLGQTSQDDRVKLLSKFITKMQGLGNFEQNEIFTAADIKDRNPDFVARELSDRWGAALKQLSLTPPVIVSGHMELNNYKYDFDTSMLFFPSYENPKEEVDLLFRQPARGLVYSASMFNKPAKSYSLLAFLNENIPHNYNLIRSDRRLLAPRLPMSALQAEKMLHDRIRIALDASYRITAIDAPDAYGSIVMEGSFLGMVMTADTGVQFAAIRPEDLPLTAPEQTEPEQSAPPEPEPVVPSTDASTLAVVGITLGMPLEEALAKVASKGKIIFRADIEPDAPENVQNRYTLVALDNGETFALHVADKSEKPVIGIARNVPVAENVTVDSIRQAFFGAYGEPSVADEKLGNGNMKWLWEPAHNQNDAGAACIKLFHMYGASATGNLVSEEIDSQALADTFEGSESLAIQGAARFLIYTGGRWPRVAFPRIADLGGCLPFLNVYFHKSNGDLAIWIHLVDPAAFAKELAKARPTVKPSTFNSDL